MDEQKEAIMNLNHGARFVQTQRRSGLSVIYVVLFLLVLVGFVSLAVDIGRSRVTRLELQTTADAAARAAASGMQVAPTGVDLAIQRAVDVAELNTSMDVANGPGQHGGRQDNPVVLDRDEDIEFGIWRPERTWKQIDDSPNSPVDERREANAVRVWGRRTDSFIQTHADGSHSNIQRNTGLPLIFGPVIGVYRANIEVRSIASLTGGRTSGWGFVGLHSITLNGTPTTDSYDASKETYPGVGGANKDGGLASNGDINLIGRATVWGDVRPGVEGSIKPMPLGSSVSVTGYMSPLSSPVPVPLTPGFNPPEENDNDLADPANLIAGGNLNGKKDGQLPGRPGNKGANYVLKSWNTKADVTIRNDQGPVNIFISGSLKQTGQAKIIIQSKTGSKVTFWVNGDFDEEGGGIIYSGLPANLEINLCKAGSEANLGGNADLYAHVNAPASDVTVDGTSAFFGSIMAWDLTVGGTPALHYDQSITPKTEDYKIHLVK
jgi:hypothetical protein